MQFMIVDIFYKNIGVFLVLSDVAILLSFLSNLKASLKCFGCKGPVSPHFDFISRAFSTISPINTLAIPLNVNSKL